MEFFLEHPMLVTYLFLKLDVLMGLLHIAAILATAVVVLKTAFYLLERNCLPPDFKKLIGVVCALSLLDISVPSAKDVAIMYGVSTGVTVGKNIANSPISNKALELLDTYVEKELDNAKKSLEKSK